jgi:hypothetical protein
MQMLDQQIVAPLALAEQRQHLVERGGLDLPAFRMIEAAPPAGAGMDAPIMFRGLSQSNLVGWAERSEAHHVNSPRRHGEHGDQGLN